MTRLFPTRLRNDERGATMIEFAFVAPSLILLLMGGFDFAHGEIVGSVLQGEVEKAGRDSALEGSAAATAAIDATVRVRIDPLVGDPTYTFTRKNVVSFERAGQAEPFTDTAHGASAADGLCNLGESYSDENNNGSFDTAATAGSTGQGGARDIAIYSAQVSYPRLFPLYGLLGLSPTVSKSATTVLRNQPYGVQATRTAGTGTCA